MAKDLRFLSRFFNPRKSPRNPEHGIPDGRLVWDSSKKGTYVRAIHGKLK